MTEKITDILHTTDNRTIRADHKLGHGITTEQIFPVYKDPYFKEKPNGNKDEEEQEEEKKDYKKQSQYDEIKERNAGLKDLENVFVIYNSQGIIVGDSPKEPKENIPIITKHVNENA